MAGVGSVPQQVGVCGQGRPRTLIDNTPRVRAAGLSLNLKCQQVPDQYLREWLTDGGELTCLFLDPDGVAALHRLGLRQHIVN
jgi:hypothetical protein